MKIIFEKQNKKEKQLTIADVEVNQFFVCSVGYLCQKVTDSLYTSIADENGLLSCEIFDCNQDYEIERILPKIAKIEF
jgi:hypothetical protein